MKAPEYIWGLFLSHSIHYTPNMMNAFDIIEREIKKYPKTVIIGHIQPDGDCIGSSLGMKYLLRDNYGIEAIVVNQDIKRFDFLGTWTKPGTVDFSNTFVIQVDNSVRNRSADTSFMDAPSILKIDHHIVMDSYGHENVEELLSSCCEIIASHAIKKGLKFSKDAAMALYTGMVTDTGHFIYAGVDANTLKVASILLETGFDMTDAMSRIKQRGMNNVDFIAYAYSMLSVSEKGVLNIYIPQSIIDKYSLTPDMVSEALSCMRDIKDHPIYVLFADLDGKIRVEFRSNRIKINQVAEKFGGGGHAFACGARISSTSEIPAVIAELEKYMPKLQ